MRIFWGIALILTAVMLSAQDQSFELSGYTDARLFATVGEDESRRDLYGTIYLQGGQAEENPITFTVYARASQDLDAVSGATSTDEFHPFASISDSYSSTLRGDIYQAHADYNSIDNPEAFSQLIRAGRQYIDDVEFMHMDGLRLDTRTWGSWDWMFRVYGGVPANMYDASVGEDWMYGLSTEFKPWAGNRSSIAYLHVRDGMDFAGIEQENRMSVSSRQVFGSRMSMFGQLAFREGQLHEGRGSIHIQAPIQSMTITLNGYALLETIEQDPTAFDRYVTVTEPLYPFYQAGIDIYKGLGATWAVQGGMSARELADINDEARYNHQYARYYMTLSARDLLKYGFDCSLSIEQWDSPDNDAQSLGLHAEYAAGKKWSCAGGYAFQLYKMNMFFDEETEEAGTVYGEYMYRFNPDLRMETRLEYEMNDIDNYISARISIRYTL